MKTELTNIAQPITEEQDSNVDETLSCKGTSRSNLGDARFEGFGWKVRLQRRRTSHVLTLAKELVLGNALKTGDELLYYLVECVGRKALLVFLDGQERPKDECVKLNGITFLVKR